MAEVLNALAQVVDANLAPLELDEFLDRLLGRLRDALDADTATILLRDDDELVVRAASGTETERDARIPFRDDRTSMAFADVAATAERLTPHRGERSLAAAPLMSEDHVIGMLQVGSATARGFERELVLIEVAALRAASAIESARLRDERDELERRYRELVDSIAGGRPDELAARLIEAQKLESIGRLAAGVAHDFTNVLTTITGYGHLALSRLDPREPAHEDVREIVRSAERAGVLVTQLQAFSRGERVEIQSVDLNRSVRDVSRLLEVVLGPEVELELQLAPRIAGVEANLGAFEQAVINLAANARDAMPAGGRLTIQTGEEDGHVWLSFADTGSGMDETTRRRAFEPFFTTKQRNPGTGLGLTMVYGMVERLRGQIELRSQPGEGTTITIRLPAVAQPAVAAGEARPAGATILLVEDEDMLRDLMTRILTDDGFAVLSASSGQEALLAFDRHQGTIDLLVSDVVMPGLTGPELARRLRARHPQLKTLLMSGYAGMPLGEVDAFLAKPFSPFELARRIRRVLRP